MLQKEGKSYVNPAGLNVCAAQDSSAIMSFSCLKPFLYFNLSACRVSPGSPAVVEPSGTWPPITHSALSLGLSFSMALAVKCYFLPLSLCIYCSICLQCLSYLDCLVNSYSVFKGPFKHAHTPSPRSSYFMPLCNLYILLSNISHHIGLFVYLFSSHVTLSSLRTVTLSAYICVILGLGTEHGLRE